MVSYSEYVEKHARELGLPRDKLGSAMWSRYVSDFRDTQRDAMIDCCPEKDQARAMAIWERWCTHLSPVPMALRHLKELLIASKLATRADLENIATELPREVENGT